MNVPIERRPTIAGVEIPTASDLGAIPAAELQTHLDIGKRLFGQEARQRLADKESVAFQFDADAYPLVASFVEKERLCCSFLTSAITVQPAKGPVWLRIWRETAIRVLSQHRCLPFFPCLPLTAPGILTTIIYFSSYNLAEIH